MIHAGLFLLQIFLLYIITKRFVVYALFNFLSLTVSHKNIRYWLFSLLYLPGTILHEFAHFIVATLLFLKVTDVQIFPEISDNRIKLGLVKHVRADFLRAFLVGIAPIGAGLLCFYIISWSRIFPSSNIYLNIILSYLIFTVSSTMFSSKQDLVELVFIIPLIIMGGILAYIFNIDILSIVSHNRALSQNMVQFFKDVNLYLFFSLILNIGIGVLLHIVIGIIK